MQNLTRDISVWIKAHKGATESTYWDALKLEHEREHRTKNRIVRVTLTNAPCTATCWNAEEYICRCSCGGKNHGKGPIAE
jgi:hypothetical protein